MPSFLIIRREVLHYHTIEAPTAEEALQRLEAGRPSGVEPVELDEPQVLRVENTHGDVLLAPAAEHHVLLVEGGVEIARYAGPLPEGDALDRAFAAALHRSDPATDGVFGATLDAGDLRVWSISHQRAEDLQARHPRADTATPATPLRRFAPPGPPPVNPHGTCPKCERRPMMLVSRGDARDALAALIRGDRTEAERILRAALQAADAFRARHP